MMYDILVAAICRESATNRSRSFKSKALTCSQQELLPDQTGTDYTAEEQSLWDDAQREHPGNDAFKSMTDRKARLFACLGSVASAKLDDLLDEHGFDDASVPWKDAVELAIRAVDYGMKHSAPATTPAASAPVAPTPPQRTWNPKLRKRSDQFSSEAERLQWIAAGNGIVGECDECHQPYDFETLSCTSRGCRRYIAGSSPTTPAQLALPAPASTRVLQTVAVLRSQRGSLLLSTPMPR